MSGCMTLETIPTARANDLIFSLEDEIRGASRSDACVMLSGQSGLGKRAVADTIHQLSGRRRGPFVVTTDADGLQNAATAARNGTLLIQDVENLDAAAQLQLLRFVDRKSGWRTEVRFMTGASGKLFERVQAGAFRDDLFYRLNIIHVVIPSLPEHVLCSAGD